MAFLKLFKREIQVAFSRKSQPNWFRILKYLIIGIIIYIFWGNNILWFIFGSLFIVALALHFWYRYKTKGWTQSYGMWKYN